MRTLAGHDHIALLVLLLAGLGAACRDAAAPDATAAVALASTAEVDVITDDWEQPFTFDPDGSGSCITERVSGTFRTSFRATYIVTADGRRRIESIQYVERGSSGVGLVTGATYRVVGGQREHFSDGLSEGFGAGTAGLVLRQRWVGPEGNFAVRLDLAFTITPDGELRVDRYLFTRTCG